MGKNICKQDSNFERFCFLWKVCYWEEDISKQIKIASLLMVILSIPLNKLSCLMASSSSRSSSSMKGRSEGLRVLTLLEFVDGFDSNKLFSSCFCGCDCDGVWADCGLCDSTPPEEYLSVCNFSSSIWSIWKSEMIFYVKVMWVTLGI